MMYSCTHNDVQLYTQWCTVVYAMMYSCICNDVQLYTQWCTVVYAMMYSYTHNDVTEIYFRFHNKPI
jgi:hypothetical protein